MNFDADKHESSFFPSANRQADSNLKRKRNSISKDINFKLTLNYSGLKPLFYAPSKPGQNPTGMAVDFYEIVMRKMGIRPEYIRASSLVWVRNVCCGDFEQRGFPMYISFKGIQWHL